MPLKLQASSLLLFQSYSCLFLLFTTSNPHTGKVTDHHHKDVVTEKVQFAHCGRFGHQFLEPREINSVSLVTLKLKYPALFTF